jgi:hypothetical protein
VKLEVILKDEKIQMHREEEKGVHFHCPGQGLP